MQYHPLMQRVISRLRTSFRSPHARALALCALLALPVAGHAAAICPDFNVPDSHTTPSTSPMAANTTIVIDASGCDGDGFGLGAIKTPPTHGTATVDNSNDTVTYTNSNGSNAFTTDHFVFTDDQNNQINVTVSIKPSTSPIVVSPSSLPNPSYEVAYSQTLSASGGTGSYTFTVSAGTLPTGLILSGSTISGTPTQSGTYTFTIQATDSTSTSGVESYSVTVSPPTVTISPPPNASLNTPYSYQLTASGGMAPYTYILDDGTSLPPGLSLSSSGLISGTPTTLGSTSFTVRASDSSTGPGTPFSGLGNFTIAVQNSPPTAGPVSATVAYGSTNTNIPLNLSGAAATSVAVATQAAHGAATATGTTITYTPAAGYAGPDTFTYTATNGAGTSSPATVTVTVSPPTITYTPAASPNPTAGAAYNHSIAGASGGAAPYTYAVTAGTLPAGLTLAANGVISGTSTAVGTFTVQVTATDSSTGPAAPFHSAPANVTLTVNAPVIAISPATLPPGSVNVPYGAVSLTASGGTAPYNYAIASGVLPNGMALSSAGVLSGTPTQAGNFNITVRANDSSTGPAAPYSGSRSYTLQIAAPTITISPSVVPNATVDSAYSQTFAASGGTAPYSFSLGGALPGGMHFDAATGTLSGTPTSSGDYSFTITATDAQAFSSAAPYTLHVTAVVPQAPTIGTATTTGSGQAQVMFTAPSDNGGAPITGYTVTSNPGGLTGTGANSPITVTGLNNGTAYTFTVTATNTVGTGPASQASNSVTPRGPQTITFNNPGTQNYGTTPTLTATSDSGLPVVFSSETTSVCTITSGGTLTFASAGTCTIDANQAGNGSFSPAPQVQQSFTVAETPSGAPVIGTATAGNTQATVAFTPPANTGGGPIVNYTATSNPGGLTGTGTTSPITVTGLTNGTAYTFTVTATNGSGTGIASAASNSVTPIAPQTITFSNPGSQNFGTSPQLNATTTSGLPVAFSSGTTAVCTVTSSGILTTVAPGTCTIHTDQAGNSAFLPAPQVSQSFAIVVPGGAVTLSTPSPLPAGTGGVAYSLTFVSSGGAAPYTYTQTGALPVGMSMSPSGTLSGTPTSSGTYSFTVTVTDAATQTSQKTYQLTINAPGIALAPSTLPQGKVGTAYVSTTVSASGGSAPYSYAVTSGAMPAGLTLSPAGTISGTPTAAGSFNVTITATDKFGFQGAQAYTIVIGQPAPIVVNDSASTNANSPVTIPVTTVDTGPITSIAITQQPAHGTATVSGLNIVYTPAANYFGSDALQYTATGPGGTSGPATVNITVVAGAVPVAAAQTATVLGGKSVTIHAVAGATNGPFVSAAVVTQPASGTVSVQGTDLVYTAPSDASGTLGFDYTVSNPFGASKPAHVTLTVNPLPVAPTLNTTVIAATSVQVNLTATAHGGPFTGARVVSVSPANAGSTSIQSTANGYVLTFTAAPTFGGSAQITYTLSNAFAESAPGTINVVITPRSDPSKNAEVLGVLDAQADATRRMATGQISNFQRRLESLHNGGVGGFSNGITMTSASSLRRPDSLAGMQDTIDNENKRYVVSPDSPAAPSAVAGAAAGSGSAPGDIAFWTGGAVNFGKTQPGTSDNGIDFTTSGVSFGADKQVNSHLALGLGVGYGHDLSDVGQNGSRSSVDSYNIAVYGSYRPSDAWYVDALVGYQWLQFDARRFVTDDGNTVHGTRDGKQLFGSLSVGYEHRADDMLLTPYARLDLARAHLDGYTETGDSIYSLAYQRQTVKTSTGTLGLLAQWAAKRDYGVWSPQLRVEFGHDMQGSSQAAMRYADSLSGPLYQATLLNQSRNHTMLGAGIALETTRGWLLRAEYQNYLDNTSKDNQSILLGVEKKFDP